MICAGILRATIYVCLFAIAQIPHVVGISNLYNKCMNALKIITPSHLIIITIIPQHWENVYVKNIMVFLHRAQEPCTYVMMLQAGTAPPCARASIEIGLLIGIAQ